VEDIFDPDLTHKPFLPYSTIQLNRAFEVQLAVVAANPKEDYPGAFIRGR
jgi:hypothetical protein